MQEVDLEECQDQRDQVQEVLEVEVILAVQVQQTQVVGEVQVCHLMLIIILQKVVKLVLINTTK